MQSLAGWTLSERTNVGHTGTAPEAIRKRWPTGTTNGGTVIARFELRAGKSTTLCDTSVSAAFQALNLCSEIVTLRFNGNDALVLKDARGVRLVRLSVTHLVIPTWALGGPCFL